MQMLCKNPEIEGEEERAGKTFTLTTDNEACSCFFLKQKIHSYIR